MILQLNVIRKRKLRKKMQKYCPQKIEVKWQKQWEKDNVFVAEDYSKKPKKYILVEFPYPSGAGLHVGHVRSYTALDVMARMYRLRGFNVMYPIGWDAFGLPTENYAIKHKIHPKIATQKNIAIFKKQLKSLGISYDWSREIDTTDPDYYQWTQWIFLKFFEQGLAYKHKMPVNWCRSCKIVLANEEVVDGRCERCQGEVEKREKEQWMLKITAYADRLVDDLDTVDYLEKIKAQQINWIGRSEGAEVNFEIDQKFNYVILHGYGATKENSFYCWLKAELEKRGHRVQIPQLPNTNNPDILEQIEFVKKNVKFDENTILIAHSLGSVVAMKVLEGLKRPIYKYVSVGGFVTPEFLDNHKRPFVKTFNWRYNFEKICKKIIKIRILRDIKDHKIPSEQADKIKDAIGGKIIDGTGTAKHFLGKLEPLVLEHSLEQLKIFTTRPDTLYGATYMVVAPEHEIIKNYQVRITNYSEVEKYVKKAKTKSDLERTELQKEKTGVEIRGFKAVNPVNGEKISVFVADYVLSTYGTGAIMAVPGHDQRDWDFAKKYKQKIKTVVQSKVASKDKAFAGEGIAVNSKIIDGLETFAAKKKITQWLEKNNYGRKAINYKLRDWIFSRQHYWGEPIPIIHCETCGTVPVPQKDLPVRLPDVKNYEPTDTGESPLATIKDWVKVKCPRCGSDAKRETDTMPNWAGSSWYFLRYCDPKNLKAFADERKMQYWMPVDLYNGGMEHTTLHLLYSRFWHKFLYDQGLVGTPEPYARRTSHGMVLAEDGRKMSKSFGNVINPDEIVQNEEGGGADTLRLYELFMGPFSEAIPWSMDGIKGIRRFLEKIWVVYQEKEMIKCGGSCARVNKSLSILLHQTIKKVGEDIENMNFNTAISQMMIFINQASQQEKLPVGAMKIFLILLSPFAPHMAEELWEKIGNQESILKENWPKYNSKILSEEQINLIIQVNGRVRDTIKINRGISQENAVKLAEQSNKVKNFINRQEIKKVIFVPDKVLNLVV